MKTDKRWCTTLLLVACSSPVLSQDSLPASTAASLSSSTRLEDPASFRLFDKNQPSSAPRAPANIERPYGWDVAIYPALAWVPIFGTSVTLPSVPSNPIAPGPSGSTDHSFNGAYFGGVDIIKNKWSADCLFMWAALSAQRTTPHTSVGLDFVFGDAMVGREVFRNLSVEAGFRRLALDVNATVGDDSATRSPGYWDPLIGLTYRKRFGKKWRATIHGDGGGFGVGSDVDVAITGRAEWQFVRHVGVAMGYGGMHFKDSNTVDGKTLTLSPTMHGPIFGIGAFF
jgi:hypothetical protein